MRVRAWCPVAGSARSGPDPGAWGKTTLGRQRRPGDDGDGFGDAGPRGRQRRPAGRGAGSSAGRPVELFASMLTWAAQQAAPLDHGDRENAIAESGRELQRQLLESTFTIDCAREKRAAPLSGRGDPARHRRKRVRRGVVSIFGPVRAERMAYRNRREANLYPADARWILPRPLLDGHAGPAAYHLAEGGYGQAQEVIKARTG